jgi:hypothetical protein
LIDLIVNEELIKWENMRSMAAQGRHSEILGFGHRDGFESIQRLMMGYAQENLEKVAHALAVSALGGEPALLAPH